MNMVRSLSAMEERIIVAKNAIAIIVVYFLIVSILVFSHCKDRPHFRTLQVFSSLFYCTPVHSASDSDALQSSQVVGFPVIVLTYPKIIEPTHMIPD